MHRGRLTIDKLGAMRDPADIECWLTDMDGVLVHENHEVPGASDLINRWVDTSKRFLVLTNNSIFTPRDLAARMQASGLTVPCLLYTSPSPRDRTRSRMPSSA